MPLLLIAAGVILAAALSPLAMTHVLVAAYTLPKVVLLATGVFLSSVGVAWAWRQGAAGAGRGLPRRAGDLDVPLLLFFGFALLSLLFSQDRLMSVLGQYNYFAYGLWPLLMICLVHIFSGFFSPVERRTVIAFCLGGGALVGLYGALQLAGYEFYPALGRLLAGRAISTLGSPVSLGAFMAALAPLALHWMLDPSPVPDSGAAGASPLRWLIPAAGVMIFAGLLSSISRGAWLAAAAGGVFYLLASGRVLKGRWTRQRWIRAGTAFCLLAGLALIAVSKREFGAGERARFEIWKIAGRVISEAPILGTGPDTFMIPFRKYKTEEYIRSSTLSEFQAHAHNDFLQVWATTGVLGLAAYGWLLWVLLLAAARGLRDRRQRAWAAALTGSLGAVFICMKFNPVPLEVLTLSAVTAAFLCSCGPAGERRPMSGVAVALIMVLGLTGEAVVFKLFHADRTVKNAQLAEARGKPQLALSHYQKGLAANPCETTYHVSYVNFLSRQAAFSRDPATRVRLLGLAEEMAADAVRCRPNEVNSYYAQGIAAIMQVRIGIKQRLPAAERALDIAMGLNPKFIPLIRLRLEAARVRGDHPLVIELLRRIEKLENLKKH